MTWPENIPSCRFSFLWFPSLTYNTEGSKSKSKQRTNYSLREMEEVTSVAETPADCGIVLNCNEYFPQLNGTPIFVARSIAIIICYKTFGGSKLNFKVESFADLGKHFLLLTCSSEQLHFLFGSFVRLLIFFTTTAVGTHAFLLRAPSSIPAVLHMCLSFLQYITDFTFMGISPEICSIATLLDGSLTLSV